MYNAHLSFVMRPLSIVRCQWPIVRSSQLLANDQ